MEPKDKQLFSNRGKYIVLTILSFVFFYLFSYLADPFDPWWTSYFNRSFKELLTEWSASMLFCIIVSFSSVFVHQKLNLCFSWLEKPIARLLIEFTVIIAISLLLVFIQMLLFYFLVSDGKFPFSEIEFREHIWPWLITSVIIALFIVVFNTGDALIMNWKNAALEVTEHKLKSLQLRQATAEAELQALKLQIDPHFVFNNLSVLSELILEDQQVGYEYSENFSKVYRYLLLYSKKNVVSLAEELKFLRSYVFLLKHRIGNGIVFDFAIKNEHMSLELPPLTLQLLIENAMKHNKYLGTKPLKVSICSGDNASIVVSNTRRPMEKVVPSSGMGLTNIIERYRLLSNLIPIVEKTDELFTVTIPLIKT